MTPHEALTRLVILHGSQKALARKANVHPSAITKWFHRRIPHKHVNKLVELSGNRMTCDDFRPDINWSFLQRTKQNES